MEGFFEIIEDVYQRLRASTWTIRDKPEDYFLNCCYARVVKMLRILKTANMSTIKKSNTLVRRLYAAAAYRSSILTEKQSERFLKTAERERIRLGRIIEQFVELIIWCLITPCN